MNLKKAEDFLVWSFVVFLIIVIFLYVLFPEKLVLTGKAGSGIGLVGLTVLEPVLNISIKSPENISYDFGIGDVYNMSLNVSADFEIDTWWYDLYDLRHQEYINQSVIFSPNTTFNAVRWSNLLTVYANHSVGTESSANVTFFVSVPNSAPILGDIDEMIYVCENNSLNYYFNATDVDENDLYSLDINPKDPFYVNPDTFSNRETLIESYIISEDFVKSDVGVVKEVVSVSDGEYVDTKTINITIIEINNPPSLDEIGAQTVWTSGDDSVFNYQLIISDTESGNSPGNFSYNLTFLNGDKFFDVDENGFMNFTGNESYVGAYNISICATDYALSDISSNISLCGQDGLNETDCRNFSLAVTNENRAPTITDYSPETLNYNISGRATTVFNVTTYDPDGNTPDVYWYVNNELKERDIGSSTNSFSYTFPCEYSGTYSITAVASDGLLNDSLDWFARVSYVACPAEAVGGAGGGGGGGGGSLASKCLVDWICRNWRVCQNVEKSLELGVITGKDYRNIKDQCVAQGLTGESCGVQLRDCFDINECGVTIGIPNQTRSCYYVEEPNCFDGIKNCHDGSCELLTDCGGPCTACATCSDKKKNQGEEGIDCGGPCPWKCEEKVPLPKRYYGFLFWLLLLILIIIVTIRIIRIIKLRKELDKTHRGILNG